MRPHSISFEHADIFPEQWMQSLGANTITNFPELIQGSGDCFTVGDFASTSVCHSCSTRLKCSKPPDGCLAITLCNFRHYIKNSTFFFLGSPKVGLKFLSENLLFGTHSHNTTTVTPIII